MVRDSLADTGRDRPIGSPIARRTRRALQNLRRGASRFVEVIGGAQPIHHDRQQEPTGSSAHGM